MYYFIVNPASGSGRGISVWKKVKAELDRLAVPYHHYLLSGPEEAKRLAAGFAGVSHPVTVVAVGGDGTINEIINGLASFKHITFGCIPTGSGNDFVRGLKLPKDPIAALHAILQPKQIGKINIGSVNCRTSAALQESSAQRSLSPYARGGLSKTARKVPAQKMSMSFAVSAGIGFDASVCHSIRRSHLKRMLNFFHSGKLVYLLTALWQLFTMKRQTIQVTVDDTQYFTCKNVYFAAAMNLRYEGGGFMFCPDALPGDDALDLIVAGGISRLRALTLLPRAFFGRHVGHHGIRILRCKKAVVKASAPICLHTDGETPGYYNEITFLLKDEKLPVILR